MIIRPLHDRVLAKRIDEKDKTAGGLFIPDTAKEKPLEALVIAVGNGKVLESGAIQPPSVKVGDKVLIGKYSASDVAEDGATTATVLAQAIYTNGVALLRTLPALSKLKLTGEQQYGVNIICRALEEPLRQIAQNGGAEGAVVVNTVREGKGAFGYNALSGEFEDLVLAGVIDPTKVVRVALQNAASVAALMLTTEALIAELPKNSAAGHGIHDAMAGMGM
jgi:chaperonin GroEL (HSP60 family)